MFTGKEYVSETICACKHTAELRQGRQVEEGQRPLTFRAMGQDRIQLLAWNRTHNPKVSSWPSCPLELPPARFHRRLFLRDFFQIFGGF